MPRLLKLDVRVTPEELARYHELAKSRQMSVSRLVRKVLDTLALGAPVQTQAPQGQPGPLQTDLNMHVPAETKELVGTTSGRTMEWHAGKLRDVTEGYYVDDSGDYVYV